MTTTAELRKLIRKHRENVQDALDVAFQMRYIDGSALRATVGKAIWRSVAALADFGFLPEESVAMLCVQSWECVAGLCRELEEDP